MNNHLTYYYLVASCIVPFIFFYLLSRSNLAKNELLTTEKYPMLDGARGLAAVFVFIHHSRMIYNFHEDGAFGPLGIFSYNSSGVFSAYTHIGQASVLFFFMITGFLFSGKLIDSSGCINNIKFYQGRIKRIFPAYLLCLTISIAVALIFGKSELALGANPPLTILSWLTFGYLPLQDMGGIPGPVMVSGVVWTLQIEWLFYVLLPFMGLFMNGVRPTMILIGTAILISLVLNHNNILSDKYLIICLSFSVGFISSVLTRLKYTLKITRSIWFAFASIAFATASFLVYPNSYSILVACGIGMIFISVSSSNQIFKILMLPALRLAGKCSYSIYILHGVLLNISSFIIGGSIGYFGYMVFSSLVLCSACFMSYVVIEKPFMSKKTTQIIAS